ncbi:MAG: calcium-binding protein [Pseudomonadota bacterium]
MTDTNDYIDPEDAASLIDYIKNVYDAKFSGLAPGSHVGTIYNLSVAISLINSGDDRGALEEVASAGVGLLAGSVVLALIGTGPIGITVSSIVSFAMSQEFSDFLEKIKNDEEIGATDLNNLSNGLAMAHQMQGIGFHTSVSFNSALLWVNRRDPLTIDLDGDGFETIRIDPNGQPILFDHDGDGIKSGTGWISADDGFLVIDRNSNGTIDNGSELFGDATPLSSGGLSANGFAALADQDTNHDGIVDVQDSSWAGLKIWRDLNQDGTSQVEELFRLDELGIASLSVSSTANSQVLDNGNQIADLGSYTKIDGSSGAMGDVGQMADINLIDDTFHREFSDHIPLALGVEALPNMQGSGLVRDLREAASLSLTLQNTLTTYSASTVRSEQISLIETLVSDWADTSGMNRSYDDRLIESHRVKYLAFGDISREDNYSSQNDSNTSEGELVRDTNNDGLSTSYRSLIAEWNHKLHVLESFNGRYFFSLPGQPAIAGGAATGISLINSDGSIGEPESFDVVGITYSNDQLVLLQDAYDKLLFSVYEGLLLQTRLKPIVDSINIGFDGEGLTFDLSAAGLFFEQKTSSGNIDDISDLMVFNKFMVGQPLSTSWNGYEVLSKALGDQTWSPELIQMLSSMYVDVAGQNGFNGKGTDADDFYFGSATSDVLSSYAGADIIYAGSGADSVYSSTGDDQVYAGSGNDVVFSGAGNDLLDGGAGNDTFNDAFTAKHQDAGAGDDTYLFGKGDGHDAVYDASGMDAVRFKAGVSPSDIKISRSAPSLDDLIVTIQSTGDTITLKNWFKNDAWRIEKLIFDDSTVWDIDTLKGAPIYGTSGNDEIMVGADAQHIFAGSGDDFISAGEGNDVLEGGVGNDTFNTSFSAFHQVASHGDDTYLFGKGDGNDIIYDANGVDVLRFKAGILPSDIGLGRSVQNINDLVVTVQGTMDSVVLKNWFASDEWRTEQLIFEDGTIWGVDLIKKTPLLGTSENDTISVGADTQYIFAGAGNDFISAGAGNDVLDGGTGNDAFNDSFSAFYSYAGEGSDTYSFGRGDGNDIIFDYDVATGNKDTICFKAGVNPSDVVLTRLAPQCNDLLISIKSSTDSIVVKNWFTNSSWRVEQISFLDGTVWGVDIIKQALIYGTSGNDSISTGGESDYISSGAGDDVISAGAGNDVLDGGTGNDSFNDSFSARYYDAGAGSDAYYFGRGDGSDTIFDYDTVAGNTDKIIFKPGIAPSDIVLTRSAPLINDLIITIKGTTDSIVVKNCFSNSSWRVEQLVFADGAIWDASIINQAPIYGTSGNDSISVGAEINYIYSGAGDDFISAGAGNDVLEGGAGNDAFNDSFSARYHGAGMGSDTYYFGRGDGADVIFDYDATAGNLDIICYKAGISPSDIALSRSSLAINDLVVSLKDTTDSIVIKSWFSAPSWRVEQVKFNDGTIWGVDVLQNAPIYGTASNDVIVLAAGDQMIFAGNGDDSVNAGAGNDVLSGGLGNDSFNDDSSARTGGASLGNDVYMFARGDGNDTIFEFDASAGNKDVLEFTNAIASSQLWFEHSGNDLRVSVIGEADSVTIKNWYESSAARIEQFKAADGKVLTSMQVDNLVNAMSNFTPPAVGQTVLPQDYEIQLSGVITESWY